MNPEQFKQALAELGWKQSDLCAKTGLEKKTPSRWATGVVPIPDWVSAYLGAMLDVRRLAAKYTDTKGAPPTKE